MIFWGFLFDDIWIYINHNLIFNYCYISAFSNISNVSAFSVVSAIAAISAISIISEILDILKFDQISSNIVIYTPISSNIFWHLQIP